MKTLLSILLTLCLTNISFAQSTADQTGVKAACMNYLEGFYEGDTTKLIASLQPSLNKLGFWKNKHDLLKNLTNKPNNNKVEKNPIRSTQKITNIFNKNSFSKFKRAKYKIFLKPKQTENLTLKTTFHKIKKNKLSTHRF